MGQNRSLLTALGAILGLLLFIYVIMQGVSYFQRGTAEFDEMQRQAGKPVLLSETLREGTAVEASGEVTTTASTEMTTTVALTDTTAITGTPAITGTSAITGTETVTGSAEMAATTALTSTADLTPTVDLTATAELTSTPDLTAATALTTTPAVTETVVVTTTAALTEATAVDGTPAVTTTAGAATETTSEAATEADSAVAIAVPAPEDVAPIFTKAGCIGCHVIPDIPNAIGAVGPNLSEIGVTGATRIEGYTAAEYIRESILEPNAFIVPECPNGPCLPGLMVQNLGDVLTPEEIDSVVAYLASLGTPQ